MNLNDNRERLAAHRLDGGSGNWLDLVVADGFRVLAHGRGLEFEIKYTPAHAAIGALGHYVGVVREALLPPGLLAVPWTALTESVAEYHVVDGVEWSMQRTCGRTRLKRKIHEVHAAPYGAGSPLMQSQESFEEDADTIADLLGDRASIGTLSKRRAKGHVVDLDAGVVLNVTETRCRAGEDIQTQVELEYSCHLLPPETVGGSVSPPVSPADLRALLWEADRVVGPVLRGAGLVVTTERKLDFVRASAPQPEP